MSMTRICVTVREQLLGNMPFLLKLVDEIVEVVEMTNINDRQLTTSGKFYGEVDDERIGEVAEFHAVETVSIAEDEGEDATGLPVINKWTVVEPKTDDNRGVLVLLPGRQIPTSMMEKIFEHMKLSGTLGVVFEPHRLSWYPPPFGPNDQAAALAGLEGAVAEVNKCINKVQMAFCIPREKVALFGYSAGAVLAIQMAALSAKPFCAVASLGGAILDPGVLPPAKHKTPVLLRHSEDDDCFKWAERYLPMKHALLEKGYDVYTSTRGRGGHGVNQQDVEICGNFLGARLGYPSSLSHLMVG